MRLFVKNFFVLKDNFFYMTIYWQRNRSVNKKLINAYRRMFSSE